jgi:membrane protease YdiL (CAAX protease family)
VVPLVQKNLHGAIAVIFLYAPALAARWSTRPFDYRAPGCAGSAAAQPQGDGAGHGADLADLLRRVPRLLRLRLPAGAPALVKYWAETLAPMCSHWLGLHGVRWRLPPDFLWLGLSQIVVVAVPEELFFRGYLLGRLEERWPSRHKLLGAAVGWPLLVSSALFAVGHVLVDFDLQRLAVFFPALAFGWMRARTGSIAAGALFHALCNLLSEVLHTSFFS